MNLRLDEIPTPAIVLDQKILRRNCEAMASRANRFGVKLRPHLKTAKSADVARLATAGQFGGVTVSTLAEAEYFISKGFKDITYAVGIDAFKIGAVLFLQKSTGANIKIVTDNMESLKTADDLASADNRLEILIEIDTGGRRGGLQPDDPNIVRLGQFMCRSQYLVCQGVLTHAGHSYHARSIEEIRAIAEGERAGAVHAAERLRSSGVACDVVSVGSTPTMVHAEHLEGVTEIRPGVYMFFDLAQASIRACDIESIAASVLCTVIGHNKSADRIIIDAGALALSKDVSACEAWPEVGYGLVVDILGVPISGLFVDSLHQEHGLVASHNGALPWEKLPIGTRVRVLPNHVCMTVAPFDRYYLVAGNDTVTEVWFKNSGWISTSLESSIRKATS